MPATPPVVVDAVDPALDSGVETEADTAPDTLDTASKPAVPAFRFPFNPASLTKPGPANYPGAGKSNHDKTPGRAPNGTRRSMGKR